jgi:hypothetical protein
MSMYERRHGNPRKREREAGKRHRRARTTTWSGAVAVTLKLGRKHWNRFIARERRARNMTVIEREKRTTGAPENG